MKGLASNFELCLFLVFVVAGCAFERPMTGHGQVTQFGETPCFSVEDNAVTQRYPPDVGTVNVYERLDTGAMQSLWEISFSEVGVESPPFLLKPSQCILYNTNPGTSKTIVKAVPLEVGKRYEMVVWAYLTPSPKEETRGLMYRGHFCLTRDAASKTIVHPVFWNDKLGKNLWDVCGLPNE